MPEQKEHLHKKLSFPQLVNLSLAVFLFLGIAVTSYTVNNLRDSDAEAARGGGGKCGSRKNPCPPTCNNGTAKVSLVSNNPVPVGTAPTFQATGYQSGELVYMVMSGYIVADIAYADSSGSLVYTFRESMYSPGGYTFKTMLLNGVNCASVDFIIQ